MSTPDSRVLGGLWIATAFAAVLQKIMTQNGVKEIRISQADIVQQALENQGTVVNAYWIDGGMGIAIRQEPGDGLSWAEVLDLPEPASG
jgi:hypothetical protein